ncbi:ATP-binding protein [Methanoregula sp.]|uniref:ATP-binding protein n=1 Tax=Methanoregula sp. TaxID=2052170 RepID=UPI003563BFDD
MGKLKQRERDAIIQSLSAGVVPRIGLEHIQVGRINEVSAILSDLEKIQNDGAAVRFIIGRYGSGKSFFLNLCRIVALEKKFVVAQADINLERRLYSKENQARALYTELVHNFAVRAKPEGGALSGLIERWISDLDCRLRKDGKTTEEILQQIPQELKCLQDFVSGYDFATVIGKYFEGYQKGDDALRTSAIRWLSGEYSTKTEARQDLGVRTIIEDDNIYDYLKLWGRFVKLAGYSGLLVNLDELGVLSHRLNNAQARNSNYETILHIVNDCLQGNVSGTGFIFAGTDECLKDQRRGLVSYGALARRLAVRDDFNIAGLKDFSGPVIELENLSKEDTYVLLHNIRSVFAYEDPAKYLIPDKGIEGFLQHCQNTLGAEFFLTPGDIVKSYVRMLSILEQNPGTSWEVLLNKTTVQKTPDPIAVNENPEENIPEKPAAPKPMDDLVSFKL